MIADYFLIHRGHYSHRVSDAAIVNWRAVWAFVIGLVINVYLGVMVGDSLWHTLPLIGLVLYLIFSWRQLTAAWAGRAMVSARNPL
jgi:purine-cytosine permease-like protein